MGFHRRSRTTSPACPYRTENRFRAARRTSPGRGYWPRVAACVAAAVLAGSLTPSQGWADVYFDGQYCCENFTLNGHDVHATTEIVGGTRVGVFTHINGNNQVQGHDHLIGSLTLGDTASGNGTYNLSNDDLNSDNTVVGNLGTGTFNQTGGHHEVGSGNNGGLTIGSGAGGSGTYTLAAGELHVHGFEYIGLAGAGTFVQNGGSHQLDNGALQIGVSSGSSGAYTLNAGTLQGSSAVVGVSSGSASFNQNGGTFTLHGNLSVGSQSAAVAMYTLSSGSLQVGSETIGDVGTGTFEQDGGTHAIAGALILGNTLDGMGGIGNFTLTGGSLTAGSETIGAGSFGSFVQTGGTNQIASGHGGLIIAQVVKSATFTASFGSYSISGGSLTTDVAVIGAVGRARFFQQGASVTVTGALTIGATTPAATGLPSNGRYFLIDAGPGGPATTLTAGSETVGDGGFGRLFQNGATNTISGGLVVANQAVPFLSPSLSGEYNLSDGILTADFAIVGQAGIGIFSQAGGTVRLTNGNGDTDAHWDGDNGAFPKGNGPNPDATLVLGNAPTGNGTFTLDNGSTPGTLIAAAEIIGNAGTGSFTQNAGTNQVSSLLVLGGFSTGNGMYTMNGGTLTVRGISDPDDTGLAVIGGSGTGLFIQNPGSSVSVDSLVIGWSQGGNGTYTLLGDTLSAGSLTVGLSGTGTFNLSGGTVNIAGSVVLGGGNGGAGFLNVSGGPLTSGSADIGSEEHSTGTATVTAPGSWTITAGNLVVGDQGQGTLTIARGGLVTTTGSNGAVIGGEGSGVGTVTVTDPGSQLSIGGFLTVGDEGLGTLNVQNGGLVTVLGTLPPPQNNHPVNPNDIPPAAIVIGQKGLLAGNGTVQGSVLNNGTVRPQTVASGGAVTTGTLTIQGSYTQGKSGTLGIEVTPVSGNSSRLSVSGPASLTGTLALAFDSGTYVAGDSYVLLTGNSVSGTFAKVTQTGTIGLLQPQVTYTPVAVDMMLVAAPLQSFATTPNQSAVASSLQQGVTGSHLTGGDLLTVTNALLQSTPSQAQAAFTAMAGSPYVALPSVAVDTLHAAAATVFGHWGGDGLGFAGTRFLPGTTFGGSGGRTPGGPAMAWAGAPGTSPRLDAAAGDAAGLFGPSSLGFWAQGLNGFESPGDPLAASASAQTTGLLMGRDFSLSSHLTIGTTFGSWQSNATMNDASGQSAGLTTGLAAVYGRYTWGDWALDGLAGYTFDTVQMSRPLAFIGRTASAAYSENDMIASLQLSRQIQWGGVTVAPGLGFDFVQAAVPTITETGAGSLDLTIAGQTMTSMRGIAGVRVTSPADGRAFGWTAYAGYAHEFGPTTYTTTATLAGVPGAPFTVSTVAAADSWATGMGFNWRLSDGADLHVSYDALLNTVQSGQNATLGLDLHF